MAVGKTGSRNRRPSLVIGGALAMLLFVAAIANLAETSPGAHPSASSVADGPPDNSARASGVALPASPGSSSAPTGEANIGLPPSKLALAWVGKADWQLHHPSRHGIVTEAFADAPSYLPGDTFRLAVSTTAAHYVVTVFRLGPDMPNMSESAAQPGVRQAPAALADESDLEVRAPWRYTYSQVIPAAWPSGIYLVKVTGLGGADAYTVFTIRSLRASQVLFVENFVTDEAYNAWGGTSFYKSTRGDLRPGIHHASAVSLDRPFDAENGAGQVFEHEAGLVLWLERNGYDVTYTTDYDLATHPTDQPLPKAVLFSGHDEYWGTPLRDWLDLHVLTRGDVSLGVFAANTGFYPVHFRDPTVTGPRTVVVYKEAITDPSYGSRPAYLPDGRPKLLLYRNLPFGDPGPGNRPEQALLGVQYGFIATRFSTYTIAPTVPAFLLTGTGLAPGDSLGALVGGEVDFVEPSIPMLPGDSIIAVGRGFATRYGAAGVAQAIVRKLPSGGRVFAAGTFNWEWGLDAADAKVLHVPRGFDQFTKNIVDYLVGG
jgi:hypothetical protein